MKSVNTFDQLKQQISAAFPCECLLSHSDCFELRTALVSLNDEDVIRLIGRVLLDLLETHTSDTPDWADSVVRFLGGENPTPVEFMPNLAAFKQDCDAFESDQIAEATTLFNKFTKEQATAIYEWLRVVMSWEAENIPKDELVSALECWRLRSSARWALKGPKDNK